MATDGLKLEIGKYYFTACQSLRSIWFGTACIPVFPYFPFIITVLPHGNQYRMPPPSRLKLSKNNRALQRLKDVMLHSDHYLYRGEVWFLHPESSCTKIFLSSAKTYVGNICANETMPEMLDCIGFLDRVLRDDQCSVFPQLELDADVIEVSRPPKKEGLIRSLASVTVPIPSGQQFHLCQFQVHNGLAWSLHRRTFFDLDPSQYSRLQSPRMYCAYDPASLNEAGVEKFRESVENSFPDLQTRVEFLNKFYQCTLGHGIPLKLPKLIVCGEQNSGKTTWLYILKGRCALAASLRKTMRKRYNAYRCFSLPAISTPCSPCSRFKV